MGKKMFWLAAYIITGMAMLAEAIVNKGGIMNVMVLAVVSLFYFISLNGHFKELKK